MVPQNMAPQNMAPAKPCGYNNYILRYSELSKQRAIKRKEK